MKKKLSWNKIKIQKNVQETRSGTESGELSGKCTRRLRTLTKAKEKKNKHGNKTETWLAYIVCILYKNFLSCAKITFEKKLYFGKKNYFWSKKENNFLIEIYEKWNIKLKQQTGKFPTWKEFLKYFDPFATRILSSPHFYSSAIKLLLYPFFLSFFFFLRMMFLSFSG